MMQTMPIHNPRTPSQPSPLARGRDRVGVARGVTLIELVMVLVITGVIGTMVAVFIRQPVEGYLDTARRAEMTDIADTALRRITRDLRTAVPNSVRVDGAGKYIEYLQSSGGGRYRAEVDSAGGGNILDFTIADTSFDVIGPMPALAAGNFIVIYNLTSDPAISTANAYALDNLANYASNSPPTITLSAGKLFPFPSPGKRFQVVQYPVTYACEGGVLRRYWGYTIQHTPQPAPPSGGNSALLATNVTDCSFSYSTSGASGRTGTVALVLQIEESGEKVRLFQQAHVNNVP